MQAAERTFICQPDKLKQPTPTQNSRASYHEGIAPAWLRLSSTRGGPGPAARAARAPQAPNRKAEPGEEAPAPSPASSSHLPALPPPTAAAPMSSWCDPSSSDRAPLLRGPLVQDPPGQASSLRSTQGKPNRLNSCSPPQKKKVSKPHGEGNGNLKGKFLGLTNPSVFWVQFRRNAQSEEV